METSKLKKFAQFARRTLISQVGGKLDSVLAQGAAARREHPEAVKKLEHAIANEDREQVIERVAYIWFNRFCALRYMDVNDLNPVRAVSPLLGQFQPEILAEAKAGTVDEGRVPEKVRAQIRALLDGRVASQDPQAEAYRLLLVAICNDWNKAMPFLFERIDDYTELLLPDDLLSSNSILAYTREAMTPDVCQDIEIIGWLYQFYISEKKDQVFAGLKKNQKIAPENIPAATQLFTPHWIVRYLVENSLGRLWMLNRPDSTLAAQMDYFIAPEHPEKDFLRVSSPEEIKICDPACGSGHMLTYAFDLLYAIYEEEGYDPSEIPDKILNNNLFGIEIDERAGALAAFALVMKAAGRRKRFLRRPVQPNVCVVEDVSFKDGELAEYVDEVGRDLFTADLRETLGQFAEAKNFGSLIVPKLRDVAEVARVIAAKDFESNLFLRELHERVQTVIRMADFLNPKYHVVVANPPYMGVSNANSRLSDWAKENYPDSKADLFAMFMERSLSLCLRRGAMAMINMQSWMFLSSFEKLRRKLLSHATLGTMAHLGERGFDTIGGAVVSTTAFVFLKSYLPTHKGEFLRLVTGGSEAEKSALVRDAVAEGDSPYLFRASSADFESIPGNPITYWLSPSSFDAFKGKLYAEVSSPCIGMQSGDNSLFFRFWHEISDKKINRTLSSLSEARGTVWAPLQRGGNARKWYGSETYLVNLSHQGSLIRNTKNAALRNSDRYFGECVCWNRLSQGRFQTRYVPSGFAFDDLSPFSVPGPSRTAFSDLALLGSNACGFLLSFVSSGFKTEVGHVGKIPLPKRSLPPDIESRSEEIVRLAKADWDAYETSWDFTTLSLLAPEHWAETLAETYSRLRIHWQGMTKKMQQLEEDNNRIFIEAYGLQDDLKPELPLEEITLTCNPAYGYGGKRPKAELEDKLREDTVKEFISYAVGCMFGRYSLDEPGLILASQDEGLEDYLKRVPVPTFSPDKDNVIPILDGDWFADDIADRFRRFLRTTFGEARFSDNLAFVETALGKDIRRFFLRDFYDDHVRRYKKRPIYWLFSSPKGTFNVLIYMHRYRSDTVSTVLEYLREFRGKLEKHRSRLEGISISSASMQAERAKALKDIESASRDIDELDGYERDVLFPLATRRLEIDLDRGVKVNYAMFGSALKPIKGLSDAED